jgi:hypothetical protein
VKSGTTFGGGTFTGAGFLNGINTSGTPTSVRVANITVSGVALNGISLNNVSSQAQGCIVNVAGGFGILATTISDCTARTCGFDAIFGFNVANCYGIATSTGNGVGGATTLNCYGESIDANGLNAQVAFNCSGTSTSSYGLAANVATNCVGRSTSGIGLYADYSALSCFGSSQSGTYGLQVIGTASFCAGARFGGTALKAAIGIGCTTFGGSVDPATVKFLGTP